MPLVDQAAQMTVRGFVKAHRDYRNWTGGYWLREAPEYMATTYVAKELSSIPANGLDVTLEEGVRWSVRVAAGGTVRRRRLRPEHARFDIVLWRRNTPRGVVEVKLQPTGFARIRPDVERICDVLRDDNDNTFQFGLIGFFRSFDDGARTLAVDRLNARIETITSRAECFVECEGLRFRTYPPHVRRGANEERNRAWGVAVIGILRQQR